MVLPELKQFNEAMIHYKTPKPGQASLLDMLVDQQENLQELYDFRTEGEGSLGSGLVQAIASTIDMAGKAGSSLISSISKGTETLINSTANGLTKIIGGIPNLILFSLNLLIIGYLIFQRWEMQNNPRKLD